MAEKDVTKTVTMAASYSIKEAAAKLGLSDVYIRRMIHLGKIATTKIQVNETDIWRHQISEETLTKWRNTAGVHTVRSDGRSKFILYATAEELADLQTKTKAIIEKANKPEDVKRRYQAQKVRKLSLIHISEPTRPY